MLSIGIGIEHSKRSNICDVPFTGQTWKNTGASRAAEVWQSTHHAASPSNQAFETLNARHSFENICWQAIQLAHRIGNSLKNFGLDHLLNTE